MRLLLKLQFNFFFDYMRLLLKLQFKLQLILHDSIIDMYNHIFILSLVNINVDMAPLRFLTLSNIRGTPNSQSERKTAFTRAQGLQRRIFKLNSYNASAETRTPSLTNVREGPKWLAVHSVECSKAITYYLKKISIVPNGCIL